MVVIGAGFAGLSAAKSLSCMPVALTIIDQRNHHLFQPLLYQVAMAGLSPADIATPIRGLFSGQRNVRVLLDQVTGVDTQAHEVLMDDKRVPFDVLIVSTGARHAYFGHDDWEPFAPGLKQIEDAIAIRRRILIAFEHAEAEEDADERRRLLTFAVIGAGATGVELAGAIAELAKVALAKDFRTIEVQTVPRSPTARQPAWPSAMKASPHGRSPIRRRWKISADQISGQLRQERIDAVLLSPV